MGMGGDIACPDTTQRVLLRSGALAEPSRFGSLRVRDGYAAHAERHEECRTCRDTRNSIRYRVSAGSGFTLSSGMPACMVISVIDTRS